MLVYLALQPILIPRFSGYLTMNTERIKTLKNYHISDKNQLKQYKELEKNTKLVYDILA